MHFWLILKLLVVSVISVVSLYLLFRALKKLKMMTSDFVDEKTLSDNLQLVARIGGWHLDLKALKFSCTSQVYSIYEISPGTPLGLNSNYQYYEGDHRERLKNAIEDCMKGVPFRHFFQLTTAKGNSKWVECTGQPIFDKDNTIIKLRGTIQDVSDSVNLKIESEEKYLQTETLKKQMSMIMNHSPAAVYECLKNKNWTMKYISPFIEKLTGYPASDFINDQVRSYASIIHPDDVKKVENTVSKSTVTGIGFDLNYRILTKNGDTRMVWERGSFEASTGNLIGIIFDQTEQKSYEKLLDESQSVAKLGNWSFDLLTQEIKWSDQLFHLFPEKKEIGPPTFERLKSTIHIEDQKNWSEKVSDCIQKGISYKMRHRVVHPDKILWVEAIGKANRNDLGEIISLSGTCQDVSETVRIEESLNAQRIKTIQSTKLASLGEMSAGVAHEINNPLAIISGNLQILIKDPTDLEKTKKKLEIMMKATERISKIVNGLKKFSRFTDHTERQPQLLASIVQETMYILEIKAKQSFVDLRVINESQTHVLCNNVEIEQVVINLVNNSLDAIKNLKEKWIIIRIFDHLDRVVLQVEDSGHGVSPLIEEKLFDPFFTTKSVGEGTGLGLSITKGILDEHKAEIALNKATPHTCFEIRFPQYQVKSKHAV
jgi:signal transduction histidine kinase/PAS domain-containing protein